MNDKELLELAAKAAGVCLHPSVSHSYGNWGCDTTCTTCGKDPSDAHWNPLANDGDALRLAVALLMEVYTGKYEIEIHAGIVTIFQPTDGDIIAATRRAIVRVAAEIGKAMP